jgi:hypothetical protein
MTAICCPAPQAVAQDMLHGIVHAICDRPWEVAARREALAREVVHSVMSFAPRDPVEIMFAGLTVAHYHLILDSTHDALRAQLPDQKMRTRSGVVALDRTMVGHMKEIRAAQTRPEEEAIAEAQAKEVGEPMSAAPDHDPSPPEADAASEVGHATAPASSSEASETLAPHQEIGPEPEYGDPGEDRVAPALPRSDKVALHEDSAALEDGAAFAQVLETMAAMADRVPEPVAVSVGTVFAGAD